MCQQDAGCIQQAELFQRFYRTFVIAPLSFLHVELALVAVGVKSSLIMPGDINRTFIGLGRGIKHVLQSYPNLNTTLRAAMPLLDERFISIEFLKIIMVRMLCHIRDQDRTNAESR